MTLAKDFLSDIEQSSHAVYDAVRIQLGRYIIEHVLLGSLKKFEEEGERFPFPEPRELQPWLVQPYRKGNKRFQETLVILLEGSLPKELRGNIRVRRRTALGKELVGRVLGTTLDDFVADDRVIGSTKFPKLLGITHPLEGGVLIQRDPTITARNKFVMTDVLVKIDYPLAEAASELTRWLRYVTKSLGEKDEVEAEGLERKFFEYFGFDATTAGTRREAAAKAAQLLRLQDTRGTVYVASQSERTITRLCGSGVMKYTLHELTKKEMQAIEGNRKVDLNHYAVGETKSGIAVITKVLYDPTTPARRPDKVNNGRRTRPFSPRTRWRKVAGELLLPNPESPHQRPLDYKWITRPHNPLGIKK